MPKTLADLVGEALRVVPEIAPEAARALLDAPDRGGWHFVDVREQDEWQAGRIPGARHFPRGFLEVRADLAHAKRDPWLADRRRRLLLYCGGGHRSALAAKSLLEMGFSEVASLAEGWSGWTRRGYPTER
ncbi:MAG TPA: rhodanese-like domain-containing protein [Myxococcota bacterium]|nr:rhodanese-like domain-containing protein [Myxococcota bacterium]